MPAVKINRSILMNASPEKVFGILNDFNHWTIWSPWLIQEPGAKVKIDKDAKYYEWDGKQVGSGNMRITNEVENQAIDYHLNFLKPWKSEANVKFELQSEADGTRVTWYMDTNLPFFMFWMKKMMEAYIGFDYERGLKLLKDYVEDGVVHSSLEFKGASSFAGCKYIGVHTSCNMSEMKEKMTADFSRLADFAGENKDNIAGSPFTIYHKWDMVKGKVDYTSGMPVKDSGGVGNGLLSGEIPQTSVYTVAHKGPYDHLGNAWSTMYNLQRNKVFKNNKKIHPFEIYLNDPTEVPANELITEVYFATK